eukprot:453775-Rhodomonas_salina.1
MPLTARTLLTPQNEKFQPFDLAVGEGVLAPRLSAQQQSEPTCPASRIGGWGHAPVFPGALLLNQENLIWPCFRVVARGMKEHGGLELFVKCEAS